MLIIQKIGQTAYNRIVYASPPKGGSASVRLGHSATPHSHGLLQHIFAAQVFASQSPHSGCKNVLYNRNVKRHAC